MHSLWLVSLAGRELGRDCFRKKKIASLDAARRTAVLSQALGFRSAKVLIFVLSLSLRRQLTQ